MSRNSLMIDVEPRRQNVDRSERLTGTRVECSNGGASEWRKIPTLKHRIPRTLLANRKNIRTIFVGRHRFFCFGLERTPGAPVRPSARTAMQRVPQILSRSRRERFRPYLARGGNVVSPLRSYRIRGRYPLPLISDSDIAAWDGSRFHDCFTGTERWLQK